MNQEEKLYPFDQPGRYRICAQGQLSTRLSGQLSDMEITVQEPEGQKPIIVLTGEVRDQAALMGVLNALYNMRCSVLKVEQLNTVLLADDPQVDEASPSE